MSGLMHNYYYGKAGQADYTVDQLPTNRRQLFFTTLKVRFSSLIGLNLIMFLFMLPMLIWLFVGISAAVQFADPETAWQAAGESTQMRAAYEAYSQTKTAYENVINAQSRIDGLSDRIKDAQRDIERINNGEEVANEASVTGVYTLEEMQKLKVELEEQLASARNDLVTSEDAEAVAALRQAANEAAAEYDAYIQSALSSNVIMSLLILAPLVALGAIGRVGAAYVLRNWARDDHSFMWQDFKDSVKTNWKQALGVGLINGFSFLLFYVAYITYGQLAGQSGWFFLIPQAIMVVLLLLWWMANELMFVMMVTYNMRLRDIIRNSIIMSIAKLPKAFLILLLEFGVPFAIALLVPLPINVLVLLILYGIIGFAFTGFVQASFANECFDRFLNPRIEGAEVNKGLHTPEDDDEDDTADTQQDGEKQERFWEHNTK
ncbi:MAG: DUF624 domain-containing protein [Clostridia bacterium]|nr:DUF624 domain-containing protein [Clostridia bacterium]